MTGSGAPRDASAGQVIHAGLSSLEPAGVDLDDPGTWPLFWAPGWGYARPRNWSLATYMFQRRHGLHADGLEGPRTTAVRRRLWRRRRWIALLSLGILAGLGAAATLRYLQ